MHIYRIERKAFGNLSLEIGLETYLFNKFRIGQILNSEEFFIERTLYEQEIVDDVVLKPHRSVKGRMIVAIF